MMAIVFIIINLNIFNIIIIDLYSFRINRENIDWIPNIIYLFCDEIIDDYDYLENYEPDQYLEDCEPLKMDNYYSDQEYWFDGDE